MKWIGVLAVVMAAGGCSSPTWPAATTETEISHADPVPANQSGEWDAVLVIVAEKGPLGRPGTVADAAARADGTDAAVTGVLMVDTAYHEAWMCERVVLEESPRCDGLVLRVEGIEAVDTTAWPFRSIDNVRWLEQARLFGRIEHR